LDKFQIQRGLLPSVDGGQTQFIIVGVGPIGPIVTSQIVPQVLHWVELWGIGRQGNDGYVLGNPYPFGYMKTRLIPDHYYMHVWTYFLSKLPEKDVDHLGMDRRGQQPYALARLRTHRCNDIEPVIFSLPYGPSSAAPLGPNPR